MTATVFEIAHAELGASSAKRWMECPGSVRLSRGLPESKSWFAAEGTVAHDIGETCLQDGSSPFDHVGREVVVEGFENEPFEVTDEMAEAVIQYVGYCREIMLEPELEARWIERKVGLSDLATDDPSDPLHKMFGTSDFTAYLGGEEQRIVTVDYKHGAGVAVDAVGNPQGRYYALGALLDLLRQGYRPVEVQIVIIQPRAFHPDGPIRQEFLSVAELFDWAGDLVDAAWRTMDPEAPLKAGDHCRFCRAAGVCPELQAQAMEKARLVFSGEGVEEVDGRTVQQLSVDELRRIVDAADQIKGWVDSAKKLAHDMLDAGQDVPGYKLVPKRPVRQWTDEKAAVAFLTDKGVSEDTLYVQKFASPAQAEKLVKGEAKKGLQDDIKSVSSGNTLAPETDKRESVEGSRAKSAQEVFSQSQ